MTVASWIAPSRRCSRILPVFLAAVYGCADATERPRPGRQVVADPESSSATPAPPRGDSVRGGELFGSVGCNGCHTVAGVGGTVGPDLTAVGRQPSRDPARWSTPDAYVRASLLEPSAYVVPKYTDDMPAAEALGLSPRDVDDLVAYLMTLRG